MSFETLLPLIKKSGSLLAPADFHNRVNVAFHDVEAIHYDGIHADMWKSLSEQVDLLVSEISSDKSNLRLLDIGCGTGLSTQMLIQSAIGDRITDITLLDTSPNMLARAKERSQGWHRKVHTFNGVADDIEGKFDIIIVCSVLHHIPDLKKFLSKVDSLQEDSGFFIHLQDPNGDYMNDPGYLSRIREYDSHPDRKSTRKSSLQPVKDFINRLRGRKTYIDKVNDALINDKSIKYRMTAEEIWSVTDIHVEKLPYSIGNGISLRFLHENLLNYRLLRARSYGFFGKLKSELPVDLKIREQKMIDSNEMSGRHVSGVWIKGAQR